MERYIVLDTETTGLSPQQGHRIIEVGCVEIANRRVTDQEWHQYINPERAVEPGAQKVHGISNAFLKDKEVFSEYARDLWDYLEGGTLIIHNAPFDMGFLEAEFARMGSYGLLRDHCEVIDTLTMARERHRGQQNNLDALCRRYQVDSSAREHHGALLDAHLLAQVYLRMTGGQEELVLGDDEPSRADTVSEDLYQKRENAIPVVTASDNEAHQHASFIQKMKDSGACQWSGD